MNSKTKAKDTYYRLASEAGVLPTRWAYTDLDEDYDGEDGFQVWDSLPNVVAVLAGEDRDGSYTATEYPFLILVDADEVADGTGEWYSVEEFENPRQIESQKLLSYVLAQLKVTLEECDYDDLRDYCEENATELLTWLNKNASTFEPIRKDTL